MLWSQFMPILGTRPLTTRQRGQRNNPKLLIVANVDLDRTQYHSREVGEKNLLLFVIRRVQKKFKEPAAQNPIPTFDLSKVLMSLRKRAG
jgi:hypothetical protein